MFVPLPDPGLSKAVISDMAGLAGINEMIANSKLGVRWAETEYRESSDQ